VTRLIATENDGDTRCHIFAISQRYLMSVVGYSVTRRFASSIRLNVATVTVIVAAFFKVISVKAGIFFSGNHLRLHLNGYSSIPCQ